MSKHELIKSLRQEIKKLNRRIDQKIILGMPYGIESRRHKLLLTQLNRLSPVGMHWFNRSMSLMGTFMF